MAWTLERQGSAASRVPLTPVAGDITLEVVQPTGVFDTLDGNRVVWNGPRQPVNIDVPELWYESKADVDRLVNLVTTGQKLLLADDMGFTYTVRAVGGVRWRILDTAGRATAPKFLVTLELVGVR